MAEETDTTQKPKAELIKRAPVPFENSDHENAEGSVKMAPEHGERRKVIVVKKKPPAPAPVVTAPPAAPVKRPQPKVVVARLNPTEGEEVSEVASIKKKNEAPPPQDTMPKPEEPSSFPVAKRHCLFSTYRNNRAVQ